MSSVRRLISVAGREAHRRGAGFLQSVNPASGEVMKTFQFMDYETLDAKVDRLKASQKTFDKDFTLDERAEYISVCRERLLDKQVECAEIMTLEMGKPIGQATAEVLKCADLMQWYADKGPELIRNDNPSELPNAKIVPHPYGLILQFAPFNFPFWQVIRFGTPALLGGNSVLLRHSHACPQTALMLEEIFAADDGAFIGGVTTLFADTPSCAKLIDDPRIQGTTFTGSTPTGAQVGMQSAAALKKCILELGGSDPFVVLPDADVTKAAEIGFNARIGNCGQVCVSPKRFIVHEDLADEFLDIISELAKGVVLGAGMDPTTTLGPLARADLVDDIERQVNEAIQDGAKLIHGGTRPDPASLAPDVQGGFFFEPTILAECGPHTPSVYYEETFGPVCVMTTYAGNDEVAMEMANDSIFGLGGAVFSEDLERAEAFAEGMECGIAFVNGAVTSHWTLPFGGMKESGYGRECGVQGIREWLDLKSLTVA